MKKIFFFFDQIFFYIFIFYILFFFMMNGKSVKIKVAKDKKAPSICYLIGGVNPKLLSTDCSIHFCCTSIFLSFLFQRSFSSLSFLFATSRFFILDDISIGTEQDPDQGTQEHLTFTRKEVGGQVFTLYFSPFVA